MFDKILVVCSGNICRSPVAEAMLRQALPDKHIQSAGLTALVGQDADPSARELAKRDQLDLAQHQARQIDSAQVQWAELILVMSQQQRQMLGEKAPEALGKTLLLGHWLRSNGGQDIPDPYKKSSDVFEHVHNLMRQAVTLWVQKI